MEDVRVEIVSFKIFAIDNALILGGDFEKDILGIFLWILLGNCNKLHQIFKIFRGFKYTTLQQFLKF